MTAESTDLLVENVGALDPLTPAEIRAAAAAVRGWRSFTTATRFVSITTAEPARRGAEDQRRAAEVVVHDPDTGVTSELIVELINGAVSCTKTLEGVQPQMTTEEFFTVQEAVRRSPDFVRALRRRGIEDLSTVDIDPVSAGAYGRQEEEHGRRLARLLCYVRPSPGGNAYARPSRRPQRQARVVRGPRPGPPTDRDRRIPS